jgi:MFS family permease
MSQLAPTSSPIAPSGPATPPFPEEIVPTQTAPRRVVALMGIAQFATYLALLAPVTVSLALKIQTIVPEARAAAALGTVLSVAALMALVANPVIGRLSDRTTSRWGRRRPWMIAGAALFLVGMAVVALAGSVPAVLVGWMLGQLGGNMILAPLLTTIADQVPAHQRGSVSGNVGVMQNLGILAAAYVASWFVNSMLLLFLLPAVVVIVAVAAYCVVLPDRQVRVRPEPGAWRAMLRTFWVDPRRHPDFGFAWVSRFLIILASFLFITFRVFYLQDRVGLPADRAVQTLTVGVLIYTIALVATAKIGGWLSDRTGRRKIFVILPAIVFGLGTLLLAFVGTVPQFYAVEALMGAGYGLYYAVDMALVVDVLPNPDDSAKDLGVMNIANALPQSLAGALGGVLLSVNSAGANYELLFGVAAGAALLGALAILPIRSVR